MTFVTRPSAHRLLLTAGLGLCLAAPAAAQGRVRGLVLDRDGAPIIGATVAAEEVEAAGIRDATTDDRGRFSFIGLNRGDWRFVVRADGFEPVQGMAGVRVGGPGVSVQFTMERDPFNPPVPTAGVLAGLKASDILEQLAQADELFDSGDYDAAIEVYRAVLEAAPALTSLHLQIGHAHQAQQQPDLALAAYNAALDADPSNVEAQAAVAAAGAQSQDR